MNHLTPHGLPSDAVHLLAKPGIPTAISVPEIANTTRQKIERLLLLRRGSISLQLLTPELRGLVGRVLLLDHHKLPLGSRDWSFGIRVFGPGIGFSSGVGLIRGL